MAAKVVFLHYRVGKTDGVSLQIETWTEILRERGYTVAWAAGPVSTGADFVIRGLELQLDEEVARLNAAAYKGGMSEEEFIDAFNKQKESLKEEFRQMLLALKPDVLWVSNIFAVGEHLAATAALHEVLLETKQRVVAIHHDFYWESPRYKKPAFLFVSALFERSFPPQDLPTMKHVCINSLAQKELKERKGVSSVVFSDTLDFEYPGLDERGSCGELLKERGVREDDLVILQGTRIVRRKNIELAIDFAEEMGKRVEETGKRRVVLVLAGYAEKRDEGYRDELVAYAKVKGVSVVLVPDVVGGSQVEAGACSLYDIYRYAQLITYPSEYEGFGNQFLEGVRAKKPMVVFEYPVFVSDIKPLGFEVISLGRQVRKEEKSGLVRIPEERLAAAVEEAIELLDDEEKRERLVNKNFAIGKLNFGYEAAWEKMRKLLSE